MRKCFLLILFFSCIYTQSSNGTLSKIQSLIIPGWGQLSLGETKRAKNYFICADFC